MSTASLTKNTAILYVRMIFQMVVYLYTTRIVVNVLGKTDYGVYDVLAGIVVVLTFLNNTLTVCTQRYITYAIGKGDNRYLCRVFSSSLSLHFLLAIIVIILGETIGYWYVSNYAIIPVERFDAGMLVYHFSLLSSAVMVISVPYNATIIAYEKMTAFASISILDIFLKLFIVLLLPYLNMDKLILYSILLVLESVFIRIVYGCYCSISFKNIRFSIPKLFGRAAKALSQTNDVMKSDICLFKEMLSFGGWSMVGNAAVVCNTQGLNLLLNLIGGPLYNTARGIAFTVQTATTAFITSFQTAINPRITKNYAIGQIDSMNRLVLKSSRISFMLSFIIALPLLLCTPSILNLWLGNVVDHTVSFTRILILVAMVEAVANPLTIASSATGNIKKYHLSVGLTLLMVLPISCIVMLINKTPELIFITQLIVVILAQIVRIYICKGLFGFSARDFMVDVLYIIIKVVLVGTFVPLLMKFFLHETTLSLFIMCFVSVLSASLASYFVGLTKEERNVINSKISAALRIKSLN